MWHPSWVSTSAKRGRGRPPAAKSVDTRGRILRTAREVFGELGYEAATFQAIAERANLTRPAINHYFASKRELYCLVVEQTNGALIEAGIAEARRHERFAERIHAFVTTVQIRADRAASAFLAISVLESQRHPELAETSNDGLASLRGFIDWALRDAQSAGEVRPDINTDAVAAALLAMLLGMGFYVGFVPADEGRADVSAEFLRMLQGEGFLRRS